MVGRVTEVATPHAPVVQRGKAPPVTVAVVVHVSRAPDVSAAHADRAWTELVAPLIAVLEARAHARVGLVLAGNLIDNWRDDHPDGLDACRRLIASGRVELIGTALHEPVLSSIPERDAVAQLQAHITALRRAFDVRPRGCWVPWQVWDPCVPKVICAAGLSWVLADSAWLDATDGAPIGLLRTEREGAMVTLLPSVSPLEGAAAQDPPSAASLVASLSACSSTGAVRRRVVAVRVDFSALAQLGVAWLAALLDAIDADADACAALPSALVAAERAGRLVYLPSSAPVGQPVPWERWLAALPEANRLHKRMLQVSADVHSLGRIIRASGHTTNRPDPALFVRATQSLHRAQHAGVFQLPGALLPRPRARAWRDLLRAERVARGALGVAERVVAESVSLDGDGVAEVQLRARGVCAVIDPVCGAGLTELSLANPGINVVATCSASSLSVGSAHVQLRRASLRQIILDPELSLHEFAAGAPFASGAIHDEAPWTLVTTETRGDDAAVAVLTSETFVQEASGARRVHLTRRYVARADGSLDLRLDVQNRSHDGFHARIALLVDLAVASEPAFQRVMTESATTTGSEVADLGESQRVTVASRTARVEVSASPLAHVWHTPILSSATSLVFGATPDATELDQRQAPVVQGSCIVLWWPIELWGRERLSVEVTLRASSGPDSRNGQGVPLAEEAR